MFLEKIVGKEAGVPSPSFTDPVSKEQQAYGQTDDCSKDTFNQSVTRQTVDHDSSEFLSESCFGDPVDDSPDAKECRNAQQEIDADEAEEKRFNLQLKHLNSCRVVKTVLLIRRLS